MLELTARQEEVLRFIQEFMREKGMPPTRAEIADALGFRSANAAQEHLQALARKGAIEMLGGTSRGIRICSELPAGLPVVGRVAAGSPILAQEYIECYYQIDPSLFRPKAHYLLKVRGMSMRDAGILSGDLLAVNRRSVAKSGDLVVARIEDEVTVKRFRQRGNIVRLLPENPDYEPIVVDLREQALFIEGIGVGVIRNKS